ncbi:MAG: ABC transporter permease [Lachnospiraceae bacterium]|nr:ABC transporter permease [Lachnospiraceae bacterium]
MKKEFDAKRFMKDNTIWVIFIALFIVSAIANRNFLTKANISSVLMTESIIGILAVGIMWCILSRGIDLSPGAIVALSSCIVASLSQRPEYVAKMLPGVNLPVPVAILITVVICTIFGIINGALIAYTKIPAFIATLGTQLIARAAAQLYTNAYPIPELKPTLKFLGQGNIASIPVIVIIFICFAAVSGFMLTQTRFGKNVFAIGGNDQAARVAGIRVEKNLVFVYVWSAFCASVGGVLLAARSGSGNSAAGLNYELDAIAAATVGGTSHTGGVCRISGVIAGILILGVVKNIMLLVGINPYWQQVVKGLIIIGSVVLDMRKNLRKD